MASAIDFCLLRYVPSFKTKSCKSKMNLTSFSSNYNSFEIFLYEISYNIILLFMDKNSKVITHHSEFPDMS